MFNLNGSEKRNYYIYIIFLSRIYVEIIKLGFK